MEKIKQGDDAPFPKKNFVPLGFEYLLDML